MTRQNETSSVTSLKKIAQLFDAQQRHQWVVRQSTADQRIDRLERLRDSLAAHSDAVAEALNADMGRPAEISATEVGMTLGRINETIQHLDEWMAPTVVTSLTHASSAVVRYEARGVVLLFAPWNFPISLLFEPLAAIIAAGNTCIVKPNELTPAASAVSAAIIREVFDETEVAVVEGGVPESEALLELPFDHIFLTGSPRVGRTVMAAAAKNLSSVTLELGGKSPVILDETADLASAVEQLGIGKMLNSGQVCLSVDYIMVPNSRRDELVRSLGDFFSAAFYADGEYQTDRSSRVINAANFERLRSHFEDAVEKGARVAFGGGFDARALSIEPTILIDVAANSTILEQEIFGPLLPILGYDDPDEVIAHVRAGTKPLALYIYSQDQRFVEKVLSGTSSGGVTVNGWSTHYFEDSLPFGGVGDSGMGRYHGIEGFRELSHARSVAFG